MKKTTKNSSKDKEIEQIFKSLEDGVSQFMTSDRFKTYLSAMSRFHTYSARNIMLILMQNPYATCVAGYKTWDTQFHRHVKAHEHGIRILGYRPQKIKRQQFKKDSIGNIIYDEHGQPQTHEVEIVIPRYFPCAVFDVSQTEGEPLPEIASELHFDVENYQSYFAALTAISPFSVSITENPENLPPMAKGLCSYEQKAIYIRSGMSEAQTIKTLIHEIAHATLHDPNIDPNVQTHDKADRQTHEIEAESTAFVVCAHYGIDTSDYSFGYVASWGAGKDLDRLQASFDRIRDAATSLIDQIDAQILNLQKSREPTPARMSEQLAAAQAQAAGNEYQTYETIQKDLLTKVK